MENVRKHWKLDNGSPNPKQDLAKAPMNMSWADDENYLDT
jgi:hypothetical protein